MTENLLEIKNTIESTKDILTILFSKTKEMASQDITKDVPENSETNNEKFLNFLQLLKEQQAKIQAEKNQIKKQMYHAELNSLKVLSNFMYGFGHSEPNQ